MYTILSERKIISISGSDKTNFLQALLTNDITQLHQHNMIYACMLTPQGKYFADFFFRLAEDAILVDLPAKRAAEIVQKLQMYKLRKDVHFVEMPDYKVVAYVGTFAPELQSFFIDPRSENLGWRGFLTIDQCNKLEYDQDAYDLNRIERFIAEGEKDLIAGQAFPLEYNFDNLHAIDYKKGCYVGQELVARTHYLGEIRKAIVQVTSNDNLPSLGTEIYAGEQKLGIMLSSLKNKGLALIRTANMMHLEPMIKITANKQEIKLKFKEDS